MKTEQMDLPIPLAKGVMGLLPARVLARMVAVLMRKMAHRHPRLFVNLARLEGAVVLIEPTDLPHDFTLRFGGGQTAALTVNEGLLAKPSAHIKGKLEALLDMLEGRIDGDMLFFSRRLIVEGDTSVIVGLRNTLDREGLHVMEDIASLFGPFAKPFGVAAHVLDVVARQVKAHLAEAHEGLHEAREKSDLGAEVEKLKKRLSKLEGGV